MPLHRISQRGATGDSPESLMQGWAEIRQTEFAEVTAFSASSLILGVPESTWEAIKHGLLKRDEQQAASEGGFQQETV